MASSPSAAQLTEGHRLAQARIGAQTVRLMRSTWPLLDPTDLDATIGRWLRITVPLIARQRRQSVLLAGQYLRAFRAIELGMDTSFVPVLDVPDELEAITTSLVVTGPATIKEQMRRFMPLTERFMPLTEAVRTAEARTAGAAMRHALNGGRSATERTVMADRQAIGFFRVTSGKPCAFCAMLASRGPVYKSAESATRVVGRQAYAAETRYQRETRRGGSLSRQGFGVSTARARGRRGLGESYHDNCQCSMEPMYREDADWPPGARRYREIYDEAAEGTYGSGQTQLQRFRAALAAEAN